MCSLPFEPALLHAAGVPASFVGHPLMQPLLQSGSFSSRASHVAQLLQQQQQQATAAAARGSTAGEQRQRQRQQQQLGLDAQRMQQLFAKGDARSLWRVFNSLYSQQHPLAAVEPAPPSSSSSSRSPHKPPARPKQPPQPQERVLLALLPGTTEAEVVASMAGFDRVTRELLQAHPGLVAAMVVPDVLVEAAIQATNNFALQVLVVPAGDKLAAGALAAAAAALAHPGHASLAAAAAGVPLVCVRDGSLLRDGWARWRRRRQLPHSCIPNLLLGRAAVPEANLWQRGGLNLAVDALSKLLTDSASASSSSNNSSSHLQEQQHAVLLGQLLLQLVPVASTASALGQQQQQRGLLAVKSPAEAAAAALLELVQLRQQQEAQQLQAASSRNKGAPATTAGVGSSSAMQAAPAAA
jgi:lipid A disaccharide synthetase